MNKIVYNLREPVDNCRNPHVYLSSPLLRKPRSKKNGGLHKTESCGIYTQNKKTKKNICAAIHRLGSTPADLCIYADMPAKENAGPVTADSCASDQILNFVSAQAYRIIHQTAASKNIFLLYREAR